MSSMDNCEDDVEPVLEALSVPHEFDAVEPLQGQDESEASFSVSKGLSAEDEVPETDLVVQMAEQQIAGAMARMDECRPGIIQAAYAGEALSCLCRVVRGGTTTMAPRSFATKRIDEFWSHSWHGRTWSNVWTIIYMNNNTAGMLLATMASLVVCFLSWFSLVPHWSTLTGSVVYCSMLLFWRPRRRIFLDVLCIDQDNHEMKEAALISMGAFLKCSEAMVVLWDPSYTRRLWCVFELAAFLHSRPANKKARIIIRPTVMGPVFISLPAGLSFVILLLSLAQRPAAEVHGNENHEFVWPLMGLLAFAGFYVSVAALRAYFRSVDELRTQLSTFTVADSLCWCCSTGHLTEAGERLICDRKVIYSCIRSWFGSLEGFEKKVRTEVQENLLGQLSMQVFTYKQLAAAALPLLWSTFDDITTEGALHNIWVEGLESNWHWAGDLRRLVRGIAWGLGILPLMFCLAVNLAWLLRGRRNAGNARCRDILTNCFILLILVALFLGCLSFETWCWGTHFDFVTDGNHWYNLLPGSCVFAIIMLSLTAGTFLCIGPIDAFGFAQRRGRGNVPEPADDPE